MRAGGAAARLELEFPTEFTRATNLVTATIRYELTIPTFTLSPAYGIVLAPWVVEIPVLFEPLEKLEVILHFTAHEAIHWNGLVNVVSFEGIL